MTSLLDAISAATDPARHTMHPFAESVLAGAITDQQIADNQKLRDENDRLRGELAEAISRGQRLEAELREARKPRPSGAGVTLR